MNQTLIVHPDRDADTHQLRAVIAGMIEGVIAFDLQGEFYFANTAATELYGFKRRSEIQQNISKIDALFQLSDRDGNRLPREAYPAARLLRGERFTDYEVWVRRLDSDHRWVACYNGILVENSVTLCVLSVHDITTQRELEARHKATFDVNPTAMSIVRLEDLRFTEVNESFLTLTGYSRDEVIGKTALELGLIVEHEKREKAVRQLQSGHTDSIIEHEGTVRTKAGEQRTVLSEGRVIRFDSDPHLIDTYIDITERKRSENELSQAVQAAMSDPSWFVRVVQEKLYEIRAGNSSRSGLEQLRPREVEVLASMARGLSNEQIAQELGLAVQTIRNYISAIYDKLGLHSRTEAVIWARERGLIFPT